MSEKKDYLSELSKEVESKKKIDSFQEEKMVRVDKPKRNISPKTIGTVVGGVVVAAIAIGALAWFFLLRPNIEMPDFVGKTQNDIAAWAKQQEIVSTGIVFQQEFSVEFDNGQVISQSVEPGTKIKKDEKMTFVMSKGADPDQVVGLPDIQDMTLSEIKAWIADNKLSKTKITTEYSNTVEKDLVIKYELKNIEPQDFTRGSTLNIFVSKGPQPAGTVTVEDFSGKDKTYVESWAKGKKVELIIDEFFNDTIAKGMVVSQSVENGKTINEGETITIVVSKGKAIVIPDFTKMTTAQLDIWAADNKGIVINKTEQYSDKGGILSQSLKSGSLVEDGANVTVTISIGYPTITVSKFIGAQYQTLVDWCNELRSKGTNMFAGEWGNEPVFSDTYRQGEIMSIKCADANGNEVNCNGNLPLDARFTVVLSKGLTVDVANANLKSIPELMDLLISKGIPFKTEGSNSVVTNVVVREANGTLKYDTNDINDVKNIKETDTIVFN